MASQCASCKRSLLLGLSKDILPHLECQVCRDEAAPHLPLKYCLLCFSNPSKHSWSHEYTVVRDHDTLPSPMGEGWTQRQDWALLEGVERLGYGNWKDIATEALKSAQNEDACAYRFEQFRVWVGEEPTPHEDQTAQDKLLRRRVLEASQLPGATMNGYLPLREEFDTVYANDAESLIADMTFDDKGLGEDVEVGQDFYELKLKVLRNYNMKLDVRESRKRYVVERGLLDFNRLQEVRKKLVKAHPVADQLMFDVDSLSRFHSVEDHKKLVDGLARERALRDEIRKLLQYRAMGIRSFDEIDWYNREASKRLNRQAPKPESETGLDKESSPYQQVNDDETKKLLNEDELKICQFLDISPPKYLVVKENLIRASLRNGGCVSKAHARALLSIEVTVVDSLLDFFVRCQWIKQDPSEMQE